jgi:hypothetical protein
VCRSHNWSYTRETVRCTLLLRVVFPILGNKLLYDAVLARIKELGYKPTNDCFNDEPVDTVLNSYMSLAGDGSVYYSAMVQNVEDWYRNVKPEHRGDFFKLFHTDEYRKVEPIMINGYEVVFQKDCITVGCVVVPFTQIERIVERIHAKTH